MTSTQPPAEWREYHTSHHRSTRIADLWVRDLVNHLREQLWLSRESAVLDFGCGYFDVGIAVADRVGRIDGMDVDEYSCRLARSRAAHLPATKIYESNEDLPRGTYDLIFVNSVFQYLGGDAGIVETLRRLDARAVPKATLRGLNSSAHTVRAA